MQTIRVFISSPSDVRQERLCARAVLEKLKARFHGQVEIHAYLWETEFYDAPDSIQKQLERPSTFDIVVLILWSTLGSAEYLDKNTGVKYASGTRYEIADAISVPLKERPFLLVCRCRRPFLLPADGPHEELNRLKSNYDATKAFLDREIKAYGVEAVNDFVTEADFAEILRETLVKRIKEIIAGHRVDPIEGGTPEPYKGLRVLTSEDHGFFFGRSRAVHQVVDQLRHQDAAGRPFVLIFGRSGIGKSSFVRAGVVPHIVNGGVIESVKLWRTAKFEPSDSTSDLIGGVAATLCESGALPELADAFTSVEKLAVALRADPRQVVHTLRSALDRIGRLVDTNPGQVKLLLVIDPMEEIFTHGAKPEEIAAFAAALRTLCESRLVWVLGTVRIDFYGPCVEIPDLRALEDGEGHFHLPPMTLSELRDAVAEPAERAGVRFGKSPEGKDLGDELVDAAFAMRGEPLPLLAYSLQQLYERSDANRTRELSWAVYERMDRLPGMLNARADEARRIADGRMSGGQEAAWNDVFGHLVSVEMDNQRVRTYARPDVFTNPNSRILLEELDAARLIITDQDDQHRPVVTIAHEAMLRQWRALSSWIDQREALLKTSRVLASAADVWIRNGRRDEDLTLRDARLVAAEQFIEGSQGIPVLPEVIEFVAAHVKRRDADARRKRLAFRGLFATVSVALLIFAGLGLMAYRNSNIAKRFAEKSAQHAAAADNFADFTLETVLPKLDRRTATNQDTLRMITDKVLTYFKSRGGPEESDAEAVARANRIVQVAQSLESLAFYSQAAEVQKYALELSVQHRLSDPSRLAELHLALADFLMRSGNTTDSLAHVKAARTIVVDSNGAVFVDPLLKLDIASYDAQGKRYTGEYTEAVHQFRSIIDDLRSLGPKANRVLARSIDLFTESLRYAGRVDEAREVYRQYVSTIQQSNAPFEPRYQVEYAVLLGLSADSHDVEEGIRLMKEAIDASLGQEEDVAQYRYKLARLLVDAGRLDEAASYVQMSLEQLLKPNSASPKLGKCYEVRARLRLQRGEKENALDDARHTFEIRSQDKKYRDNPAQREFLDAHVLMVDCLLAGGKTLEAARFREDENRIRKMLTDRESEAAQRLGEPPPNFERHARPIKESK